MGRTLIDRLASSGQHLDGDEQWLDAQSLTIVGAKALRARLADHPEVALPTHCATHGTPGELVVEDEHIPSGFIAALTTRRVLIFSRSVAGRPKTLDAEFPRDGATLDVIDHGERARARLMVFGRPDGSVFAGEAGINGEAARGAADAFVDAFRSVHV